MSKAMQLFFLSYKSAFKIRTALNELNNFMTNSNTIQKNGLALKCVKQTYKLCWDAIQQNGMALKYVHKQTPKLCLAAVKINGRSLEYVHKRSPEINVAACENCTAASQFLDEEEWTQDIHNAIDEHFKKPGYIS